MSEAKDVFIESDGALFKGFSREWPCEVWDFEDRVWRPYVGSVPKGIEWGWVLSPEEFDKLRDDLAAEYAADL